MVPNLLAFPIAFLGIVRAGAAQVNVNPLYTPRELEHQLNDAGVEIIVIFNGVSSRRWPRSSAKTGVKTVITAGPGRRQRRGPADAAGGCAPARHASRLADVLAEGASRRVRIRSN